MTVIVGIVTEHGAIMGADRAVSDTYVKLTMGEPKIRDFDGRLIGYAGSITVGRAIFRMIERDQPTNLVEYVEQATLAKPMSGAAFLIIENRELWEIEAGAAIRLEANYSAIGSGLQYALGSLYRWHSNLEDLRTALNAAEHFAPDVRGPMVIITA